MNWRCVVFGHNWKIVGRVHAVETPLAIGVCGLDDSPHTFRTHCIGWRSLSPVIGLRRKCRRVKCAAVFCDVLSPARPLTRRALRREWGRRAANILRRVT